MCARQGAAQAHTNLVSSYPASGASVSTLPDQVVLEFDEPMNVASRAPAVFRTQMVALFFLSVALGSAMSGFLVGFYSAENEVAYFGVLGGVAIALGVLLAAFSRPIRKLMAGVH